MKQNKSPYIFVLGNEKGGAGKTTCSIHLIAWLMDKGHKVASIDTDSRQHSLTSYIENRKAYNLKNPTAQVLLPQHYHLLESIERSIEMKEQEEKTKLEEVVKEAGRNADYIVIDTAGSHSTFSIHSHSLADTIISPANDSLLDIHVMAEVNPDDMSVVSPSIYSQMIWEQKMARAARNGGSIEWIVMRNRLSNLDAVNKRNVGAVLEQLSKRIGFKVAPGFSERVIFRELFLQGLTLLDLTRANYNKALTISHVAARQELRDFVAFLGV